MTSTRDLLSFCATLTALAALTGNVRSQRVLAETFGTEAFARYGAAVASIGDIDGDGVRDLVIGEPARDYAPAALVIDSGAAVLRSSRTGILRARQFGLQAFGLLGSTVAGLGDVDGDGVPDWATGSPVEGQGNAGYAQIMSGADGHILWGLGGEQGSELGTGIAALGDVNNDGRADVAISSPNNSNVHPYGAVRCYAGNTGAYVHQYAGLSLTRMGQSIASIADVTGDGRPDLIVGESQFSFGGSSSGRVYLLNPSRAAASGIVWEVYTPFLGGWHGGQLVASAGDVNGDGVADVLAGTSVGRIAVLSGTNGSVLRWHQSSEAGYGASMAGIGDYDGDGRSDYAVGAPQVNSGSGRVIVYSGATGAVLQVIDGPTNAYFGAALAAMGDFDGDGRADFAVGSPYHLVGGAPLGRVSIHGFTIAPIADTFGTGCAGSSGVPDLYIAGTPRIGTSFATRCANLPANTAGFWLAGWSNTSANGTPLPANLSAFGIPGCQLLVSPDSSLLFLTGISGGYVSRPFSVPMVPALAGMQFYTQAAVLDVTHAGGLTFSNGGRIRIGNS